MPVELRYAMQFTKGEALFVALTLSGVSKI